MPNIDPRSIIQCADVPIVIADRIWFEVRRDLVRWHVLTIPPYSGSEESIFERRAIVALTPRTFASALRDGMAAATVAGSAAMAEILGVLH